MAGELVRNFTTIFVDLGNVLVQVPPGATKGDKKKQIPPISRLISTPAWNDYDCGNLNEDECYEILGKDFGFKPSELGAAMYRTRRETEYNADVLSWIQEIKRSNRSITFIALWRTSPVDYAVFGERWTNDFFSTFDDIFTSFTVGLRQPSLGFYRYVLRSTGVDPRATILLDNDVRNLTTACSLKIHSICVGDMQTLNRTIRNMLHSPVLRADAFLCQNSKSLHPYTNCGTTIMENYVQLLILDITGNEDLITLQRPNYEEEKTWKYYIENPFLTELSTQSDLDTTSLALQVSPPPKPIAHLTMDKMLEYVDSDGLIQVYFDHRGPKVDPVICLNVLTTFYMYNRGQQLQKTTNWVYQILLHRAYLHGTYHYDAPEWFLFWVHRLLQKSPNNKSLRKQFRPLLKQRIQERIGIPGDSLKLALRLRVCHSVGLANYQDLKALREMQCEDGGWESGYMYSIPIVGKEVYERGFTTALAVNVIKEMTHNDAQSGEWFKRRISKWKAMLCMGSPIDNR